MFFTAGINANGSLIRLARDILESIGLIRCIDRNFIFQWIGRTVTVYLPPHEHRDNLNGGFAFACYHPSTGLPQQPWAQ